MTLKKAVLKAICQSYECKSLENDFNNMHKKAALKATAMFRKVNNYWCWCMLIIQTQCN